jgi:hypothetical protein
VGETDFDGWADLGAQRRAEDEALVQRYAAGEGRGLDMRPVRGFVRHVRRDIGPKGIISRVRMTKDAPGHEICVWYRIPPDGERPGQTQTASVTDVQPAEGGATGPAPGGLAGLARASAAPPPARTTPVASPNTTTARPAAASAGAEATAPPGTAST